MLLEALIAMLIFMFGVLGVVGLQAAMTKAQTSSKFRADASFLAQQLIGTMWADAPANLGTYADAGCGSYSRCSSWLARVADALPLGTASVTVATSGLPVTSADVTIRISWTPPNEQQHTYTTVSTIATNQP
jgi:type IV pilus assembly protein PilV